MMIFPFHQKLDYPAAELPPGKGEGWKRGLVEAEKSLKEMGRRGDGI